MYSQRGKCFILLLHYSFSMAIKELSDLVTKILENCGAIVFSVSKERGLLSGAFQTDEQLYAYRRSGIRDLTGRF